MESNSFVDWILDRLGEKSTWVGVFTVLAAAGLGFGPELRQEIIAVGLAVVGLVNVILAERRR